MKEPNYQRIKEIILPFIPIFLIFSFIFLVLGFGYNSYFIGVFEFMLSVTIAFISLYLGVHSVILSKQANTLGEESKKIANDSDEKMKAIANVHFIECIERVREYEEFCKKKASGNKETKPEKYDILGWWINIKKANELKEWANEDRRKALSISLHSLLTALQPIWQSELLTEDDKTHIHWLYNYSIEQGLLEEDNKREIMVLLKSLSSEVKRKIKKRNTR